MKELFDKYYTFTTVFVVLSVALFVFKGDKDITNLILGALVGVLTAPKVAE